MIVGELASQRRLWLDRRRARLDEVANLVLLLPEPRTAGPFPASVLNDVTVTPSFGKMPCRMHVFVIGATGGIGRALVEQASRRGHRVMAFARSPQKLGPLPPSVTAVRGDPRSAAQLQAAMAGCEAVLSALGPPIPLTGRTTIMGEGAKATAIAMSAAGIRRLLIVSGDLQFRDAGPPLLLRLTLLRHLAKDQAELERAVLSSGLEWTIVRPTKLTNGSQTGAYRAEEGQLPRAPRAISRADVAQFLLGAVEQGAYVQQIVGLAR